MRTQTTTIAIPIAEGHVAPVFETASSLLVVRAQDGRPVEQGEVSLTCPLIAIRALRLAAFHVDVVVCNAIGAQQAILVRTLGIRVVRWATGDATEVARAYLAGQSGEEPAPVPAATELLSWGWHEESAEPGALSGDAGA